MSDRKAPLVTEAERSAWVAPPSDDKKPIAKDTKLCVYCSRYHGSVNKGIECVENGVRALRAEIDRLHAEIATLKTVRRIEHGDRAVDSLSAPTPDVAENDDPKR